MTQKSVTVDVDVSLDDFTDDDLVDELESRGFKVTPDTGVVEESARWVGDAAWRLQRGEVEEALHIIARHLGPQMRDLPEAVRKEIRS